MTAATDALGLVQEGQYLTIYIPPQNRALVFRVLSRINAGAEKIPYGRLPLTLGETLPTYDGGTVSVPADGVLPGRAYTPVGRSFPLAEAVYDTTDMWYTPKEDRDHLFHVIHQLTPSWLRTDVQIPRAVTQGRFQKERVMAGIDRNIGYRRGRLEIVHIPEVYYGFRWGNDSNLSVYTGVCFTYAEYVIEVPKDATEVFNILVRKIPSHWVSLPVSVYDRTIERALISAYGFEGFPLYPAYKKDVAIEEYSRLLEVSKV